MTARAGSAAAVLGAAAARTAARADHERRLRGAGLLPGRRDRTELELLTRPRLLRGEDQLPPPPPPPPPPQRHRDLPTPGSSGSLSSSSTATTRSSTMDLSFMAAQSPVLDYSKETVIHAKCPCLSGNILFSYRVFYGPHYHSPWVPQNH
nr:uncharacterized protein C14orf132 homolog isoform X3 [Caretta caretta]